MMWLVLISEDDTLEHLSCRECYEINKHLEQIVFDKNR